MNRPPAYVEIYTESTERLGGVLGILRFVVPRNGVQQFIEIRATQWRLSANATPHSQRRFVVRKTRKLKLRLRRLGINQITAADASIKPTQWIQPNPSQVKIVVAPNEKIDRDADRNRKNRKTLRRLLRDMPDHQFEVLSSRHHKGAAIQSSHVSATGVTDKVIARAVYLETVGAVICPELTPVEIKKLEASGAVVLSNDPIELVDAVSEKSGEESIKSSGPCWHLAHIGRSSGTTAKLGGHGIIIGVLDTGIDATHSEFQGKNIYFQEFGPNGERVDRKSALDHQRHGTHVCGLCAGKTVGVAADADLAVAAVLTMRDPKGNMYGNAAQILAGINWLLRGDGNLPRPVDVINASLSKRGIDPYWHQRVGDARDVDGVLFVAAIGNNGRNGIGNHGSPGNYDVALGIGAVDETDTVADFSDWGPANHPVHQNRSVQKPDMVAPGVNIRSAIPRQKYLELSGTSMASPLVAGTAALLLEGDPTLKGDVGRLIQGLTKLVKPGSGPGHPQAQRRGAGSLDHSQS